ncbi:MAG: FmdB family zinc ribbon protein [Mycobacteriales bacterium]
MPTYQYVCTSCARQLEAVQSFSDAALAGCPQCNGSLRKVFSSVGVVFKGSGFYRNDSRDAVNKAAKAAADEKTSSNTEAAGASKDKGSPDLASNGKASKDTGGTATKADSGSSTTSSAGTATKTPAASTS